MNRYLILFFSLLSLKAAPQKNEPIVIETKNSAIVLNIAADKRLLQSYIGRKLETADYSQLKGGREAYLTAGMENQFEPAIRMVHSDGNPSLVRPRV